MTGEATRVRAESKALKVLISGAYGTGKTTLCRRLCGELTRRGVAWRMVPGTPRQCPFLLNRDQTFLASSWLIGAQIREEAEQMVGHHSVVICDRGIPDILSHTNVIVPRPCDMQLASVLRRICEEWVSTYDAVFATTVDASRPIEGDGVRVTDKQYQLYMEKSIYEVFRNCEMSPIVVSQDTERRLPEVLDAVVKMLSDLKSN